MSTGWLLAVGALLAAGVFWFVQRLNARRELLERLRADWGKQQPSRRRDLEAIRAMPFRPGPLRLDDATWADLDLDAVYVQLDRTLTEPGQQALHEWLRTPLADLDALKRRSAAMEAVQGSAPLREDLQSRLEPLGKAAPGVLARLLVHSASLPPLPLPPAVYTVFTALSFASLLGFLRGTETGFLLVAGAFALDAFAHYSALHRVTAALPALSALQKLFGAAVKLTGKPLAGLEPEQERLRARLESLRDVGSAVSTIGGERIGDDTFGQYIDIFTLREERLFCRAAPLISARKDDLLELVLLVGELDALQSIASWRAGLGAHCTPEFRGAAIEARGVRHPLVEGCVPNDVRIRAGVLVTGSNMSGKSTYLRAVSLNALLAQVANTCLAESWSGPPVRLMTCLRRADSVLAGRSAYLSEAQGVLDIVRAAGSSPRLLCVLDEIFRGTNSLERVAAATEVLRWLAAQGALVLSATHDHALTSSLGFENVHFTEQVAQTGISFDHLLKPGPANTTNAIALLRFLGFPEDIVTAAERARAATTG